MKGQGGYTELALGQGQNQAAIEALQAAATAGAWLCIKNTHLAVSWLPEFHRKLAEVAVSAAPGFRLWMTSEPHEMFPADLLSASLVRCFMKLEKLFIVTLLQNCPYVHAQWCFMDSTEPVWWNCLSENWVNSEVWSGTNLG